MRAQKPREIAARILQQQEKAADYVENLLEAGLPDLAPADRGLCQELVYGAVRWQRTLDWLIARKTEGRTQKTALQILLRLGLYQMFWLDRIPDHAAVHETVELAKRLGLGPQAGFLNAILRACAREREQIKQQLAELKVTQPGLGHSHPDWLCDRWQKRWGANRLCQLLEWNNTPPKTFARVNTLRTDAGPLVEQWRAEGVEYDFLRRDWLEENLVFELKSHPPLSGLPSFQQGLFYVQDPSTLLAVRQLDPRPGETVLDLCAAPGGKTAYIAQRMQDRGRVVACDRDGSRLKMLRENCLRLGVTCVEPAVIRVGDRDPSRSASDPTGPRPAGGGRTFVRTLTVPLPGGVGAGFTGPGREHSGSDPDAMPSGHDEGKQADPIPFTALPAGQFERVLVDAPCSNTGVMRRRVDLRWRIRPGEIERLHSVQLELLHVAAGQTKPGGVLVYSTCSLEPEENNEVVKEFLATHTEFTMESERDLVPFEDGVDGAYGAKFQRHGQRTAS
ncbi:MAG TPA: transcription antitermination factor NusB [Haliangiales bacterium]|nr:transcription antitermination factor NusB [Haliangiales bacterium]